MLSLDTAQRLKAAGLIWSPQLYDFFFVPMPDLDERVFVISDMSVIVEEMGLEQAITFNGAAEWALDYLVVAEVVWMPTESQLRDILEKRLVEANVPQPALTLSTTRDGYACEIQTEAGARRFEAFGAGEAYAEALLHILK